MKSTATRVDDYLAALPADRRAAISAIRKVIVKNLDAGYEEGMQYGMISYYVPHRVYPAGHHANPKLPLNFASLGSQKNYMLLLFGCLLFDFGQRPLGGGRESVLDWFKHAWTRAGKKLGKDIGKGCIRFKKLDDVPLKVVGELVAAMPSKEWIKCVEEVLAGRKKEKAAGRAKLKRRSE
jgi:hypothetical protein